MPKLFLASRATTTLLLLASTYLYPSANAQSFRPIVARGSFYNFVEGRALYIAAGNPDGVFVPLAQSFSIDLSVSWNASSPKFNALPEAPAVDRVPSALSADGKQWLMCSSSECRINDIGTSDWTVLFNFPGELFHRITATTDPETGLIYIPNAFDGDMMVVNLTAKSQSRVTMAPALIKSNEFSVAWSASSRKLFFFGGDTGSSVTIGSFNAHSYDQAGGWKDLTKDMKGPIPTPRKSSCLVSAYGGTKLIYFGGYTMDRVKLLPEIFLFDVATLTWTSGPIPPKKDQRGEAACGVSGDYFITWGGIGGLEETGLKDTTAVYNMKTNLWTSSYVAAPISTTPTQSNSIPSSTSSGASSGTPSTSSPGNSSDNSHRTIVIAAGVLGVVVAALVACALLLYRRHRRRRLQDNTHKPRDPSAPASADGNSRHPHESPVNDKFSTSDIGRDPHSLNSQAFPHDHRTLDPHTSLPIEVALQSPSSTRSSNPIPSTTDLPQYYRYPFGSDTTYPPPLLKTSNHTTGQSSPHGPMSQNSTIGDKMDLSYYYDSLSTQGPISTSAYASQNITPGDKTELDP
ncbi:MAG: hypothetical protein J3Q66DRAFT_335290 [Benniella sp.]|nr:MAG: hypothetical protein J3Q66DRAFT_335290 [Benniella sp.]